MTVEQRKRIASLGGKAISKRRGKAYLAKIGAKGGKNSGNTRKMKRKKTVKKLEPVGWL